MKKTSHSGFTLIELVFVVVILGILSAIALPKFQTTKELADIAKGRSDVASIRSAILTERQSRIIKGDPDWINKLDHLATTSSADGDTIFDNNGTSSSVILSYGIIAKDSDGHWKKTGYNTYAYKVASVDIQFDYNSTTGSFTCDRTDATTGTTCKKMVD